MDLSEIETIEFLDLTGVDEEERTRVLSSLRCGDSNQKLPWFITDHVPSRQQSNLKSQKIDGNVNVEPQHRQCQIPVDFGAIPQFKPQTLQSGFNVAPNYSVPHTAYTVSYQVCHIPPVPTVYSPPYPHVIQSPPASVIYSPEHAYSYHHQPVPLHVPFATPQFPNHPFSVNNGTNQVPPPEVAPPTPINENHDQTQMTPTTDHVTNNVAAEAPVKNVTDVCPKAQNGPTAESSPANKSWASLFSSNSNNSNINHDSKCLNNSPIASKGDRSLCPIKNPRKAQFIDPTCYRMGEYLIEHVVDGRTISLQPRGLINKSNYCYINSILQALLACPPVYNLLSGLAHNITSNEKRKPTPVIDSMCKFVKEFEHLPAGMRVGRRNEKNQKKDQPVSIVCDAPFEPNWIYRMLNGMRSDSFLVEGRQEDAEEFLGCLLNGLNDEMQELIKLVNGDCEIVDNTINSQDQDGSEWQVMGPKNKGSITRKTTFLKTPISNIFGGLLKSRIHRAGDESSNNIQPFFTLPLNIEKVKTVGEALEALVSKNQLEGVTSSKTNEEVEAWQQVTFEELPVVLILHLKCFDYKLDGCTKILKALEFPIDLKIDAKWLSSKIISPKEKQYKLFAVVYHDGKEASKGHYITDAFHVGYNSWVRYDDASVKAVSEDYVLSPQGSRVPYLLFYRRSDTIRSK